MRAGSLSPIWQIEQLMRKVSCLWRIRTTCGYSSALAYIPAAAAFYVGSPTLAKIRCKSETTCKGNPLHPTPHTYNPLLPGGLAWVGLPCVCGVPGRRFLSKNRKKPGAVCPRRLPCVSLLFGGHFCPHFRRKADFFALCANLFQSVLHRLKRYAQI